MNFSSDDMVTKRYLVELEVDGIVVEKIQAYPADLKKIFAAFRTKGVMSRKDWKVFYRTTSTPYREEEKLSSSPKENFLDNWKNNGTH